MASATFMLPSITLTVKECSEELRCSTDLVRDLVRRGDLPASKVGACIRISRDGLDEYLIRSRVIRKGPVIHRPTHLDDAQPVS